MTVESESRTDAGVCYRHPKRESRVLCQRCGRPICPECQIPAAVGVQCPECVNDGHATMERRPSALARAFRPGTSVPVVTYSLMAVTALVFLLQFLTSGALTQAWVYAPVLTPTEPWRMLTSVFLHSQTFLLHIVFNLYALFLFGRVLEPLIGHLRFVYLYVICGLAGSVGVLWLASPMQAVLGASGAVFGLMGAYFVIQRHLGGSAVQLLIVIGLNLALGFFVSGVAWQAHVGGLVIGVAAGLILVRTRRVRQRRIQLLLLGALALLLAVLTVARFLI